MSIHGCTILAIDGTHSSGKTTLATALTQHYQGIGLNAVYLPDPARESPLIAAVIADPAKSFDLTIELDLFAATITQQIRATPGHRLVVTDKTLANVLAYARLLLKKPQKHKPTFHALTRMCRAWQPYDLVIRCVDHFPIDVADDPYRSRVTELQEAADYAVGVALDEAGYPVVDLPAGLSTDQRIQWILDHPLAPAL